MKINDLERKTGLERATIRFYEKEGMITPVRYENGYRDYSDADMQQLQKIKLLRQLGMSLQKIKSLQQGSADFQTSLKEQIKILEEKRDTAQRSAQVCRQMQLDGVTYASLNADHYLNQFRLTQAVYLQATMSFNKPDSTFRESVPREYHPFRHLFARIVDIELLTALILFVQVFVFRARSDLFNIPNILLLLLWVPLEALCYTCFAATPGKLAFGIRVHHVDGTKHTFSGALDRAWTVYRRGMGWGIPIWQQWRQYKSFKLYDEGMELEWNYNSEITYHDFGRWKEKCKPLIVFTILISMVISTFYTAYCKPKYTGELLNLQQFVENYNDYWHRQGKDSEMYLDSDGTFMEKKPGSVIINIGSDEKFDNFTYIMQGDAVTGVQYKERHENIMFISPMPSRCLTAAMAFLGAQEGENTNTLKAFAEDLNAKVENALITGTNIIDQDFGGIHIYWKIEYQKCSISTAYDRVMLTSDISESNAVIEFAVTLTDNNS